ncbi:MAG TPA: UDP-glucose/GDP-mannose dehydrogenase family protein [Gemmatales bacterium]|nr:UDP-glucose/GDP-mannose dehydrogenase family protein [Gemmatales bacterium]HMP58111.1 UDP-glucose/GDP-mannose dehydrogenase family protein [Gemmatales bacterium]
MHIAVLGTGYVGLVTGTCLADTGHQVVGIDIDPRKIATLQSGKLPIYEPGLLEIVERNTRDGRLTFTTDLAGGIKQAEIVFLCVGTPPGPDGSADLKYIWTAGESIARLLTDYKLVVVKSTVPVGTNSELLRRMRALTQVEFDVASNPEFLKEGAAVEDFTKPDRVVIGVRSSRAEQMLRDLYAPFLRTERPILVMSPESAEMTKYVANAMLATKISFINEMANLCEVLGADVNDVRRGIGHDARIGFQFLFPGPGYGGSCFPKDVSALIALAQKKQQSASLIEAVHAVNERQKHVLGQKVRRHFGAGLGGKTLAVWGLAFKPRTDDIREAPALVFIEEMLAAGVALRVHDPEAMANVRELFGERLSYHTKPYETLEGADALVLITEWHEFRNPDFVTMKKLLRQPVIFDGRNLYDPQQLRRHGFTWYGIGRGDLATTGG